MDIFCQFFIAVVLFFGVAACTSAPSPESEKMTVANEVLTVNQIHFDPYGKDCGEIYIEIENARQDTDKKGKYCFIKCAEETFVFPDALAAPSGNQFTFFGKFDTIACMHLMNDETPTEELYFIYDSVYVHCPYQFLDANNRSVQEADCVQQPEFSHRIRAK